MKNITRCKTTWAAISLPLVGWLIQSCNGGPLPLFVQTWGPLAIAVGVMLLRRATSESCALCARHPQKKFR